MNDEEFMRLAIEEAKNAPKSGEKMPYGAVVVQDGEVISSAHNTTRQSFDPTAHAEINAIRKAGKILENNSLTGCTLYTTCEPCSMCFAATWWAKIPRLVYGLSLDDVANKGQREIKISSINLNELGDNKVEIKGGFLLNECKKLLEPYP